MTAARFPDGPNVRAPFTSTKGLAMRVELTVETVVSLRHQTPAALRIEPTVILESDGSKVPVRLGPRLTESDLELVDQTTFDFADRLLATGRAQPAIILPVSFFTLAARKGRMALSRIGGDRGKTLKSSVMVELVDVDRGTPISRLIDVGGLITTVCRAAFVRVQPGADMLASVRGYRPHGLTLDAADLPEVDAEIASQLLTFGEQADGAAPLLVVQGLPSDGFFGVAEVAGLTHAALRTPPASRQRSAA